MLIRCLRHSPWHECVLGSADARDRCVPDLSDPDTLLFLPLFKMFAAFGDLTGIQLINRWYVLLIVYPTLTVPFLHLDHDRLFRIYPQGTRRGRHHRRRFVVPDPDAHLHPGRIARLDRRDHLRLHGLLGAIPLSAGLHDIHRPTGAAGRIITPLIKGDVFNWGQIMTGALLGAAPPLIIYAFLMDYYIAGLTAGATKG